MKRRLGECSGYEPKTEPQNVSPSTSASSAASGAEMTDEMKQMVAALVSKELVAGLLVRGNGNSDGGSRFGKVAFAPEEQHGVNTFLHQKLGKESLARRPGPGGRKLTYIESCKAIELANRAFGFNGWSCHILECKEEFREKRGERWTIGFSSLVRIELKDGTKHEDVGFGSSDGQRDLCAALEQAKKASISDGRKRALRLFGEYLGNSCYDREHIKGVTSNRPMAPLASAPNFTLPPQPQPRPQQHQQHQQQQQKSDVVPASSPAAAARPVSNQGASGNPGNQGGVMPRQQPPQQQQQPPQQQQQQPQQQQQQPQQQQQQPQLAQQHRQQYPNQQQLPRQQPPQQPQQQPRQQPQQQHWKPPQVPANPLASANSRPASHQASAVMSSGASAVASRISAMQAAEETKRQSVTSRVAPTSASAVATVDVQSHQQQQFQQQPRQPLRTYMTNVPPPTRMIAMNHTPPHSMKPESNGGMPAVRVKTSAQYDMEDLSLSQFDYDPDASDPAAAAAKRMRM